MNLKIADFAVLGLAVTAAVYSGVRIYGGGGSVSLLNIKGSGGSWIYPMERNERLEVSGPLGITAVELKDGGVRVLSSPCTNQNCISAGSIHSRGQWIACLPNGVFISIEGKGEDDGGVDGAAW
ncbi:MAG: NusG domain II-containing protein [Treponema sp.]|jgi:hypothetical protein|nr:NusG domain II-containing protein [Treponema sp.]